MKIDVFGKGLGEDRTMRNLENTATNWIIKFQERIISSKKFSVSVCSILDIFFFLTFSVSFLTCLLFVSFKRLDGLPCCLICFFVFYGMPCCLWQDAIRDGCCLQEWHRRIYLVSVLGCYSIWSNIINFTIYLEMVSFGKVFRTLTHSPSISK